MPFLFVATRKRYQRVSIFYLAWTHSHEKLVFQKLFWVIIAKKNSFSMLQKKIKRRLSIKLRNHLIKKMLKTLWDLLKTFRLVFWAGRAIFFLTHQKQTERRVGISLQGFVAKASFFFIQNISLNFFLRNKRIKMYIQST